jgi:hypothetical protein
MQRNKGKRGEREAAELLREVTGRDVQRRVRQNDGDSDLLGLDGWCIEVKRARRVTDGMVESWWDQTVDQARAAQLRPLLLYRHDRGSWRFVWSPTPNTHPDMTVTGSADIWWRLNRSAMCAASPPAHVSWPQAVASPPPMAAFVRPRHA